MGMSRHRKQRAAATQRLVEDYFRSTGLAPYAQAVGAGAPGRDILNVDDVSVEIKAAADFSPAAFLRQARSNTEVGELPLAIYRPNGGGPTNISDWPAIMPLGDIVRLLQLIKAMRVIADSEQTDLTWVMQYADDVLHDLLHPDDEPEPNAVTAEGDYYYDHEVAP